MAPSPITPRRRRTIALLSTFVLLLSTTTVASATTASIGPDGSVLVGGEPFFPIGIYHVSWIGNR